jgi:DNA-binding Xre family transcriptional regulator
MSEFVQLSRAKLGDKNAPLGDSLNGDPEGLSKRSRGFKVRKSYVKTHGHSLSKLLPDVNAALKLAAEGSGYSGLVGTMGERMKALRLSRSLTLEEMGRVMEISGAAVSQIENGVTKNVRLDNFLRFCAHFDADPYFVVFGEAKASMTGRFRKLKLP